MSRRGVWLRLVLVAAVLAGAGALAYTQQPTLGLDLQGGTSITLQVEEGEVDEQVTAEDVDNTVEVLRQRVNAFGVSEPTIARQGENRILVELPDVQNSDQAEDALVETAQLTVHPVRRVVPPQQAQSDEEPQPTTPDGMIIPTQEGQRLEVGPARVAGDQIGSADAQQPQNSSNYVVAIDFANGGGDIWQQLTANARCNSQGVPRPSGEAKRRIAIVLDGEAISSPEVAQSVGCAGITGGSTQITGNFTVEQARDLAVLIEGGALPLPLEIINSRQVGPTLGDEAIEASAESAVIGLVVTGLFILLVYRGVGFLATIALACYALIAYAVLVGIGATLTLPGLAGFVLAIGMAIDANVLVFERAREEYAADPGRGLRRNLLVGFNKAWTAIIDSNVTTLLAAALLFALATGPVQGFGVTLAIGVLASMFSALVIARVLTDLGVSTRLARRRPQLTGIATLGKVREWLDRKRPDLVGRRVLWLSISGVVLVAALGGIVFKGLDLGVEFSGGRVVEYSTTQTVDVSTARDVVADAGYPQATIQSAQGDNILVRTGQISDGEQDSIQQALAGVGGEVTTQEDREVGPSLGEELRNKALLAFGIALAAQMAYLAMRFKWTYGVSAVLAMFHDVVIVTGLFAWLDKPIDGVFLAAALTIIGLSVNDTVVVFDRVRERWRATQGSTFAEEASRGCVETLPRTLYTSLSTLFILVALAVLGGDSLQDFSIALIVGLVVGTYSSVFLASPLVSYLHQRWPMRRAERIKQERDPNDTGAVV